MNTWRWIKELKSAIIFRIVNYLLVGAMGLLIADMFSNLTARFLNGQYDGIGGIVIQVLFVVLMSSFVIPVLQYKEANLMEKRGGEADIVLFKEFLEQDYHVVSEEDVGRYMNVLWGDFPMYRMNLIFLITFLVAGGITVMASIGITEYYSIWLALLTIVTGSVSVMLPLWFQKSLEKKRNESQEAKDSLVGAMKEVFANMEYLRLEGQKNIISYLLRPDQEKYANVWTGYQKWQTALDFAVKSAVFITEISIYMLGCHLISGEQMDYGVFVKVVMTAAVTKNGISWLAEGVLSIHDVKSSKRRIEGVIQQNKDCENKEKIETFDGIRLKDVLFSYPGSEKIIALPEMQFDKGKLYHICGSNGAGKSTLFKLIMGFYPDYQGEIAVGDSNLEQIDLHSWYDRVAYIPQKPELFHMSVKQNILFGNPDADMEMYERLVEEFRLKELEEKELGFGGEGVSGGEGQSISIVRALLRNAQMILADEPFNTLDVERKAAFCRQMDERENTAFLVISHQQFMTKREAVCVEV